MVKKSSTRRRIRLSARRETSIIFSARAPARSAGSILFSRSQDQSAVASGFLISCATKPRYFPRMGLGGIPANLSAGTRVRKRTAAQELPV